MRFWVDVTAGEAELTAVARRAGHRRTHDEALADFFVVQSNGLVDPRDGSMLVKDPLGDVVRGPGPRFEFQILPEPVTKDDIGTFIAVVQIVDRANRLSSFGYSATTELADASFESFLLQVGDGDDTAPPGPVGVETIPESVEEFLTLWARSSDGLTMDTETRRIADALVAMASEMVKTADPPHDVLRAAFAWFGRKLDRFSDEFAESAGKAFGTSFGAATGVGAAATVTGQLPRLIGAVGKVLRILG